MDSMKIKPKEKKQLYCAVCMTVFSSKQTMKIHILKKKHSLINCTSVPNFLKEILPTEKVLASKVQKFEDGFIADIFLPNIGTREHLHSWVDKFMQLNNCKYVRTRSSVNATASIIAQEYYQCQHHWSPNPVRRKRVSKGTNCKSSIYAVLKKSVQNISWLNINFVHNHSLTSPDLLRFKKPTDEIKRLFLRMFEDGATPTEALKTFKIHIRTQLTEKEFVQYSTDRSKVPDYDWARHLFSKTFKKKYSSPKPPEFIQSAKHVANEWNANSDSICHFAELDETDFFIVIITSLMKRVLETSQAGDLIFIDHCGSVDSFGIKVFLLFTKLYNNEAPVGVIITTKGNTQTLVRAFGTFLSSVDVNSFGGRNKKGPKVIFTDDNQFEVSAIKNVFSSSNDLICATHFLRSCHKWLLKTKNEINAGDRKNILSIVRQMIYALNERKFSQYFTTLTQTYENHIPVQRLAKQIYEKRKRWATCFRTDTVARMETNDIINFELRILKEQILDKIKAQCPSDLINYLMIDFTSFYEQKFIDCCYTNLRYFKTKELTKEDLLNYFIIQISDSSFIVYNKSKNLKYVINGDIGLCTCYIGAIGNYCKHQQLLSKNKKAFYYPMEYPEDEKSKGMFFYIATGNVDVPESVRMIDGMMDLESCDMIEEITEEIIENKNIESTKELVLDYELNEQLLVFQNHISDICGEIKSRKDYYLSAFTNFNKEVSLIKNTPFALRSAMFRFNSNNV